MAINIATTQVLNCTTAAEYAKLTAWLTANGYAPGAPGLANRVDNAAQRRVTLTHATFDWVTAGLPSNWPA